jgi:hypothetical protein
MIVLTEAAEQAAMEAARQAIQDYSSFYSGMVPDDALKSVVDEALKAAFAAMNANQPKGK